MPGTNTQAYYENLQITAVKSVIVQAPELLKEDFEGRNEVSAAAKTADQPRFCFVFKIRMTSSSWLRVVDVAPRQSA